MRKLVVKDILTICEGLLVCGSTTTVLGNFCNDTRKIKEGDVYVGIQGEKIDGNTLYQDAFEKGASVVILEHLDHFDEKKFLDKTIILVKNSIICLQKLATYKRSLYDIPVIAVTGSVGKTSTKDMIYSVVSQKYKTHKTYENFNNHIGVPLTILSLKEEEALVIELGMNHFNELSFLTQIVKPTMVVITNIGTAHIENLGSRENILKAKLEILEGMIGNTIILNNDNDLLQQEKERLKNKYQVITVGIHEKSDYQAIHIQDDVFSSKFDILNKDYDVIVRVGGSAFIYNSLIAYAVGDVLNISSESIKKGISSFQLSSHRLEKKENARGVTIIDDTYNANLDSMREALCIVGKIEKQRKIAILGSMLELGEYTQVIHKQVGEIVYQNKIDILITVGEYAKEIADKVIELGMNPSSVYSFDKEGDTYELLSSLLEKGDLVLVKGSHGIHLLNTVEYIMRLS